MDRALRPIANVRGGDGVAALATGHVAPDNRRQGSPVAAAQPDCRRPAPQGDDQGRWMATGRPQHRPATRRIRLPYNRLRFVMDEGPPGPVPARWPEGPCDGCEAPASGFRRPRRSPVFLPVCRHRGMSGLRPWEALTGEVRYLIDAFVGHCPGRRVSQTVPPH